MKTCRTCAELHAGLMSPPAAGGTGFVPTMGYLHEGHLSLVRASRAENGRTVVSIFVNPSQFGPGEDLQRYPRDTDRDIRLLEREGADILFLPEAEEIYPAGYDTWVQVEQLAKPLCGRSRPTHFRGVATVVLKFFNLVRPQRAYFGQKDAQQAIIIRRLIRDLHLDVQLRVQPIVRDADGLALSSRNVFLDAAARQTALRLPQALQAAAGRISAGETDAASIRGLIAAALSDERLRVDYIEIVSLDRLQPLSTIMPKNTLVACAIHVGGTRLIDNFILGEI